MERGHRAQWASGEPPAKPSGLKRARPTNERKFPKSSPVRKFPKSSPARTEASAADHERKFPKSSPACTEQNAFDNPGRRRHSRPLGHNLPAPITSFVGREH